MADMEKEIQREEKKVENFFKSKANVWMTIAIILAVILLVIIAIVPLIQSFSKMKVATSLIDNLNSRVGGGVTFSSVSASGPFYQVNVTYQGQEIPVYVTKDGRYMLSGVQELKPLTTNSVTGNVVENQEVPKTDKPKADLYVFSYCPYGLQAEKAAAPVYDLLKSKADINIVFIGAMHGEFEKTESLRQLCIQKNYGKDKFWSYLKLFYINTDIGNCQGSDSCLTPLLSKIYSQVGIDANKINTCMTSDAEALYSADQAQASSLGISGSPTWVINGVQAQVGRSPEEVKQAICSAFTDASKPSECSQTLSTSQAVPSFGSGSSSSSSAASCG